MFYMRLSCVSAQSFIFWRLWEYLYFGRLCLFWTLLVFGVNFTVIICIAFYVILERNVCLMTLLSGISELNRENLVTPYNVNIAVDDGVLLYHRNLLAAPIFIKLSLRFSHIHMETISQQKLMKSPTKFGDTLHMLIRVPSPGGQTMNSLGSDALYNRCFS